MLLKRSALVFVCCVGFFSFLLFPTSAHNIVPNLTAPQQTDPGTALSRGRSLLKQGHADQALGYLETALKLYTQTNDARGIAAAEG